MIVRQGRIAAPTIGRAVAAIRAKLEAEGWRVVRLSVKECPVQPWTEWWWEYVCEVKRNHL